MMGIGQEMWQQGHAPHPPPPTELHGGLVQHLSVNSCFIAVLWFPVMRGENRVAQIAWRPKCPKHPKRTAPKNVALWYLAGPWILFSGLCTNTELTESKLS
ncbi:hypothetical protein EYF80_012472 [Liparis tanakae]|uniref:Uncharacterized protein n=1 Tax=Liparis tanakae TaxID=230148 RepID=A0A4Z2IHP0_9TELE|nr:hypothetical protein EYF80_012472 [Liparis tanakae]